MNRKKLKEKRAESAELLHPETKKSITAILLLGIAAVLLLARFGKAGPAGNFFYSRMHDLLGWGYYLIPFIFCAVAILFLLSREKGVISLALIGAALFVISGLGLIDIVAPNRGGLLGNIVGSLEIPFDYAASIILTGSLMLSALLITFNASLKFKGKSEDRRKAAEPITEIKVVDPNPSLIQTIKATIASSAAEEKTASPKTNQEKEDSAGKKDLKAKNLNPKISNYVAPPLSLLNTTTEKPTAGDLRANANIIKRTLDGFGIPVEMGEINIGPKVTRYTLKPAEGIKLTRITVLNQDLSLALAAHPIRIEAPIPGKSFVGIEVPNKSAAIVRMGNLLSYPEFSQSDPISFFLGKDVTGSPIMTNIEKMPHLLIAGATGSGKSVAIHSMIVSLLYKNSPHNLKLILVDPKKVELSVYNGIPHLATPVITDGKKSVSVFRWAIKEMERRYEVLLQAGARDIKSYNKSNNPPLPFLLIIIDELADLMAAYGREIENSIVRLAQMARATGIHLIVATQRPSVEVITGLIKTNITSRIALQVASQIDSRTILDSAGAEKLLGGGDMLFISSEFSKPKRIQGVYISEDEIQQIAKFIKNNNAPPEVEENLESGENASPMASFDEFDSDGADDELFDESVRVVQEAERASASLLQRRLKIGYARAARLLDVMETKGLVGPADGAKPREVYSRNPKNTGFESESV